MTLTKQQKQQIETSNHNTTATLAIVSDLRDSMTKMEGHFKVGDNPKQDGLVIRIMKNVDRLMNDRKWIKWLMSGFMVAIVINIIIGVI